MLKSTKNKKPNLFIKAATGFNNGIAPIETFKSKFKSDFNCFITDLQTSNNFLTKNENENFGYEVQVSKPYKIVSNPVDMDLENGVYVIYDLETTGLQAKYDHITEIGALKVTIKNGKVVKKEEFQQFVKQPIDPKTGKPTKLKPFISKLTHITDDMLNKNGVPEKEAIERFKKFCGKNPCVGHNIIKFDARFINKKCEQYGLSPYENAQIDTMEISKLFNSRPNHTLRSMAQDLKITYDPKYQHRAIADVIVNWEVYKQTCIPSFKKHGVKNIKDINRLKEDNIIYDSQHTKLPIIVYANAKAKNRLSKTAQEYNLYLDSILKQGNNVITTNWPSGSDVLGSYINDSPEVFEETINKYTFITLPPPSFWSNIISTQTSSKILDLTDPNDKLIYENRKELKKILLSCKTDQERMIALSKSPIFSKLQLTQSNVYQMLSKMDYLNNPLCDIKENQSKKEVSVEFRNNPSLTLSQLQDAYKNIIKICKDNNKKVIIDSEIFITDKSYQEAFLKFFENMKTNPYKKFIRTDNGCRVHKYSTSELEKEFVFLDKKTRDEICFKNPQEIYQQIININKIEKQNSLKEKAKII